MKDKIISKLLIVFTVCIFAGGILPYLFELFSVKLVVAVGFLAILVVLLIIKKGRITVYDWLILYFIGIPFHSYQIMFGAFFLRLTEVFFIPFLIFGAVQISRSSAERKKLLCLKKEYIILLFFYLFSLMSIVFSHNPFVGTYRTVVLLYLIVMSFVISRILKDEEKIYFIVKTMIAVAAAASIFAIFQSVIPELQLIRPIVLTRIGSLTIFRSKVGWFNPNYFAFYITMILPITYVCKIYKIFPEKKFINTCFVLQLLGLISSYSRLGFISIALTFLCLLWVRGKKKLAVSIFAVLIILPTVAFSNMEYLYRNNRYLAMTLFRIRTFRVVSKNPLLIAGWRRDAWIANVRMFLDHPVLGVGPFMSTEMYNEYKPLDQVIPGKKHLAVHSEYLSLLSERGLIGALLFLLFLLFLTTRGIVYYKNNRASVHGKLMLGLWASIVNFMWFSFGAAAIYSVQFWINVGLIFAVYNLAKETEGD